MGLIKDIYNKAFYEKLAASLEKALPNFHSKKFMNAILSDAFLMMEWKERVQHTTKVLHSFMPNNFAESAKLIEPIVGQLRADGFGDQGLVFMFLPDYIATYGLDDYTNSVEALEFLTQFISAEFAVRPFLIKYGDQMMGEMLRMSTHENHHVRRFASEGSRPRLPWGAAIPTLKKDPTLILPILENLKNDPSEYVRRSVANNLNDITKDNPAVVIEIAKNWKGLGKETDAIIKHACRSLLKSGHPEILSFYGLDANHLSVIDFNIETPKINIGGVVEFSFVIKNQDKIERYIRLEYTLYYLKNNGGLAGKVFKISERAYPAGAEVKVKRRQSFKLITTRKFYPGHHKLAIMVNGMEKAIGDFELLA
ncbi:DNA alkylation repair protein [Pedobacter polaris]|uniref:DNA alkylation repair protein n=1 Tax=Pedobacter polaris TaxID=2571273 RepID=A0A4U1CX00_9SPHI|nr:DNA alkylation repair protein [Pedobacter polaris]TKC12830.1 DNA alkylation repair protein [Pedobacter polaris]